MSPSGLSSDAPDGSYAFRNRFNIRSNSRFNFNTALHVLSPSGSNEHIVLAATAPDATIKQCVSLNLWGSPYPNFDAAASAGRKWRQIAMSVFLRLAIGCDFGDDDNDKLIPRDVKELHFRGMLGLSGEDQVYWDRVGLLVFPMHPPPAAFIQLEFEGIGLSGLGELPDLISAAEQRYNGIWDDDLRLAYDLVHGALGATQNPDARYVFTVTAIETLIPYRKKHPDLCRVLDELIAVVDNLSGFGEETLENVKKLLKDDKRESVNKYGRELAGRLSGEYSGKRPQTYFSKAYGVRSGLAHGNPRDERTSEALQQQFLELLRFVLDILESWTERPGFDSDERPDLSID